VSVTFSVFATYLLYYVVHFLHSKTDVEDVKSLFIDPGLGWNNPTNEATLLIKEKPFEYKTSEDLIVVSLGTGGSLYKTYEDSLTNKAEAILKAATECRATATNMHRHFRDITEAKYFRFDPDAVGRFDMDDAAAFDDIQREMDNWWGNQADQDKLETLANSLMGAMTQTGQVPRLISSNII
jgi:hypothetical protein